MSARLCAMWARGNCSRGRRCPERHYFSSADEKIPCDCPEKHDAYPGERRHSHRAIHGSHKGPILGSARNFCAAFYHVKETPEAGMKEACLRCNADGSPSACGGGAPKCSGKSVVAVARMTRMDSGGAVADAYVARYMNCSSGALCAESSLLEDPSLRQAIEDWGGPEARLRIYLNASPCNYSTDTRPAWSCTETLIRFQRDVLDPRSMRLEIVCSYPYRCHWDKSSVPARLAPKIDNARKGVSAARTANPGQFVLRAFEERDWVELMSYCDQEVRDEYAKEEEVSQVFTGRIREARRGMDAFCQRCFGDSPPWAAEEACGGDGGSSRDGGRREGRPGGGGGFGGGGHRGPRHGEDKRAWGGQGDSVGGGGGGGSGGDASGGSCSNAAGGSGGSQRGRTEVPTSGLCLLSDGRVLSAGGAHAVAEGDEFEDAKRQKTEGTVAAPV